VFALAVIPFKNIIESSRSCHRLTIALRSNNAKTLMGRTTFGLSFKLRILTKGCDQLMHILPR
jgi:hypothetical protein